MSSGILSAEVANALNDFRESHTGTLSGMTRYLDHLDDMPAEGYAFSAAALGRTESFQALYFGHIANYQSRGVYNAPEQLSLYGDGVPGKYFSDSFRAQIGPGEVDVDLCVPSTMLPAMMLRWMVLFVEQDADTVALFRTLPRRYFRPGSAPAIVLERGPTRYGHVSANLTVAADGSAASLEVALEMTGRGYVGRDGLTLEVRVRGHGGRKLTGATAGVGRVTVDASSETVKLQLGALKAGLHRVRVEASFA